MVQFIPQEPHRSKVPQVLVENPLRPGRYRFSLVVVDDSRNVSEPAEITVTVVERTRPVLDPTILRGTTIRDRIPITPLRPGRPT